METGSNLLILTQFYFMLFISPGHTQQVDVSLNKPISAVITCGLNNAEVYNIHSEVFLSPADRKQYTCDSSDPNLSHPAAAMVDSNSSTWWQSASRSVLISSGYGVDTNPEVVINIDLEQEFSVDSISIQMGDSKRPGRMSILKSLDGANYIPWVYRATTEAECVAFGGAVQSIPSSVDGTICQTYTSVNPLNGYEMIYFNFIDIKDSLMDWRDARYLEIRFFNMDITLGYVNGNSFQHYTVVSLEVMAECVCSGQNIGCEQSATTGQYECICGNNTMGDFCEQCQDFYNQQPFHNGRPCEECNCFDHADSCVYDERIANFSLSLNAQNQYIGGGVCVDCRDNTAGVNCEKCIPMYYRPLGIDQRSANVCIPCECSGPGIARNPETGLVGDCIINDDNIALNGMQPGDCFCKENVAGAKCDQCKQGFYQLTADNPQGCLECYCNAAGVVNVNAVCDGTDLGQCECKTYVINRQCDQCMDEYYGLTLENPDGCSPCECDVGGSYNSLCNRESGNCLCRKHISGRQCNQPANGYYIPDWHYICGQFESMDAAFDRVIPDYKGFAYAHVKQNTSTDTNILVPSDTRFGGQYVLLLRYNAQDTPKSCRVQVSALEGSMELQVTFDICGVNEWCHLYVGEISNLYFNLTRGEAVFVRVTLDSPGTISMDQASFVPIELVNTTLVSGLLGELDATAYKENCDPIFDTMVVRETCLGYIFSLMAYYLDGAVDCKCNSIGSYQNETVCEVYGGQCPCKLGVDGRTCDACKLEYYSLSSTGCKECGCVAEHPICDQITGQCQCPPNVIGINCDKCAARHWNFDAVYGCQACECDSTGSISSQCDIVTGQCDCKPGIQAMKCTECADGFKIFSLSGCRDCNCDLAGSVNNVCNKTTGQCHCKENTQGTSCSLCKDGSFHMSESHQNGCLSCVCMGITDQCNSAYWRVKQVNVPVVTDTDGEQTLHLAITTEDMSSSVLQPTIVDLDGEQMAEIQFATTGLYWMALDALHGNLLGLYENTIQFDVEFDASSEFGDVVADFVIMYGRNDTKYKFRVDTIEMGALTTLSVTISNELAEEAPSITREEFLFSLSDVQMVLFPATYYTFPHTSRIGKIRYYIASPDGLGSQSVGVEQCNCGEGYLGLSCETCATGYRREGVDTQGYLGYCVGCECHGHADACDPDTGNCIDCQHHTTGIHCDECEIGYYGDPTVGTPGDCHICPCYEPRVLNSSCHLVGSAAVCEYCAEGYTGDLCNSCDTFYFGNPEVTFSGKCEPCFCNNNAEECVPATGECVNCAHNTTGFNCEKCEDGTYGNATIQGCQECGCDMTGSLSAVCDHVTGQCECFPGVGSRTCGQCLPDYYGFSDLSYEGCVPCGCNMEGSATTQCDDLGVCTCTADTGGDKCDLCSDFFYGLPYHACQPCNCDAVGTVDPGVPCDTTTGQCQCKSGVDGRQCDTCQRMYVGFGNTGCTACSECQFSLGNDTLVLVDMWEKYWTQSQVVGSVQEQDAWLLRLDTEIDDTLDILGASEDRLDALTQDVDKLLLQENYYQSAINILDIKASSLEHEAQVTENISLSELYRQQDFQNNAQVAMETTQNIQSTMPTIINSLQIYNTSTESLLAESETSSGSISVDFSSQEEEAQQVLSNVTQTANTAYNMRHLIDTQANKTSLLDEELNGDEIEVTRISGEISDLNAVMSQVKATADAAYLTFNTTLNNKKYAENLFAESQTLLDLTETIVADGNKNYALADLYVTDVEYVLGSTKRRRRKRAVDLVYHYNYPQGSLMLETAVNKTSAMLDDNEATVTGMLSDAQQLTLDANILQQEFQRVESLGSQAVDAINTYTEVSATLEDALQMALDAEKTISAAVASLEGVTADELVANAEASSTSSLDQADLLTSLLAVPSELSTNLTAANTSLQSAVLRWDGLEPASESFTTRVDEIAITAADPGVTQDINSGYQAADIATSEATLALQRAQSVQDVVLTQDNLVAVVQTTVENSTILQTQITEKMDGLRQLSDNGGAVISQAQDLVNTTQYKRLSLEQKLLDLENKVRLAKQRLLTVDQPLSFSAEEYEMLPTPDILLSDQTYGLVQLEFQYRSQARGTLFFMENPATNEVLALRFVDGFLQFEFNNRDESLTVKSPAVMCPGCWYFVSATRSGIDGHLVVIWMDTGGVASSSARGQTLQSTVTLTSQVYIGGLPLDYPTSKVDPSAVFEGCIANVYYNTNKLPLWTTAVNEHLDVQCCARPPAPPTSFVPIQGSASFDGFGYLLLSKQNFSFVEQSHVSFQVRTFDSEAVLLLADTEGSLEYYGLFLQNGHIVFEYGTEANHISIKSQNTYNDGQWYQVSAMHNSTYAMLYVQLVDQTLPVEAEVRTASTVFSNVDLSTLAVSMVTIGGQNPTVGNRGPVVSSFAGCIMGMAWSEAADLVLHNVDYSSPMAQVAVHFDQCWEQVIGGLGWYTSAAYTGLSNQPAAITEVEFEFLTYQASGILLYGSQNPSQGRFFYIALYNGDVYVMFDQGSGLQGPLQTRGLYLSDGILHHMRVDFRVTDKPVLEVDGEVHYGNILMSPMMYIGTGILYLGGVPEADVLNQNLPVTQSLVGGITNLVINAIPVDLFDIAYLNPSDQEQSYLSGIPAPPTSLPSPPYTTTPAPQTTPAPTCAPRQDQYPYGEGVRFGDLDETYLAYDSYPDYFTGVPQPMGLLFDQGFTITVQFRALEGNGMLLYAADKTRLDIQDNVFITQYCLALYLQDGHLVFTIKTDSGLISNGVVSKFRYDDSEWHEVTVLRINDFIALLVLGYRDYINNKLSSQITSLMQISSPLYVGGVPAADEGFSIDPQISIGHTPFHGCIRKVDISTHDPDPYTLDLSLPDVSANTAACYETVVSGVSFLELNSYIRLRNGEQDSFELTAIPTFNMTFQTSSANATLIMVRQSFFAFLVIDIYEGQIRALTFNSASNDPFIAEPSIRPFSLCDDNEHTLFVKFNTDSVAFVLDGVEEDTVNFPVQYTSTIFQNVPVYAGGVKDHSWTFPVELSMSSLMGCFLHLQINNIPVQLTDARDKLNTMSGCPSVSSP